MSPPGGLVGGWICGACGADGWLDISSGLEQATVKDEEEHKETGNKSGLQPFRVGSDVAAWTGEHVEDDPDDQEA